MTDQRFSAGPEQRVRLSRIAGELQVDVWDDDSIRVQTDGHVRELYQEGDELVIDGCDDDIQLRVPARVRVFISGCDDDVHVEGVRRVEIERASGDVSLEHIAEEIVVDHISGDLQVEHAPTVSARGSISGEVTLQDVRAASFTRVQADLSAERIETLSAETVDGDLHVEGLTGRLGLGNIGGDLHIEDASGATVAVGTVGGDLHVEGELSDLQLGTVGGDCRADRSCERAHLGTIGGDLSLKEVRELKVGNVGSDLRVGPVAERLEAGSIGGDAEIKGLEGELVLGQVGGDLNLRPTLRPGAKARVMVGGDANITLPEQPNLTINALVSGEVRGAEAVGDGRKRVSLRYGAGEAVLDLTIGGDLRIGGGGRPDSRSASAGFGPEMGREWSEFGREMGDLGRELGRLGREIADEVTSALAAEGVAGGRGWAESFAHKFDAKARAIQEKVEERARHAEERARRAEEQARVRIKINEREWQLDPERLERIKEQARRAAAEGLQGAIEAVERALGRVAVPPAPNAPNAPRPPTPPTPPVAATGQTIKIELPSDEDAPPPGGPVAPPVGEADAQHAQQSEPQGYSAAPERPANLEQERETILRMIAEGRISPEEGDLLLEALGN